MKKSDQLKQERALKEDAQKAITDKVRAEKRADWTPEEEKEFDDLDDEIKALDKNIERALKAEALDVRHAQRDGKKVGDKGNDDEPPSSEDKEKRSIFGQFRVARAIHSLSEGTAFNGVEKEVNDIAREEMRSIEGVKVPSRGFSIPAEMLRTAYRADGQTVTQDGGLYGGALVNKSGGEYLQAFLPTLTVEQLGVKVITGLTGDYPLTSSEQFAFQNLGETEKATAQKIKYTERLLKPLRTACVALISNQLLIQASIDVENDIRGNIAAALNRRIFMDFIAGSGIAPNPLGILNDDILEAAAAQGIITLAKVLELEGLVEDQNSPSVKTAYLTNNRVMNIAKQTKVDAGSGIMLADKDSNLYGEKSFKSSMVPSGTGTGGVTTYPLIFGDWDQGRVAFWGGATILTDPYTAQDSNQVKLVINVHRNTGVANPNAFAVNRSITLT